ncbi:putative ribosomal RNA adenine methyltransferase KsgA/Erm, rRNA adenine dimethylase-like protein [Septoria linicola]|nr:putative ribosomal RNA adenine methyltransferase KsgA/Erm, rRNA adenine dimethylase-like protein [Septoria linicola]
MSKVARRLLSKPNEGSDVLRVVFTPVNKLPCDKGPTRKVSKRGEWLPSVASASQSQPSPETPAHKKKSNDRGERPIKQVSSKIAPGKRPSKDRNDQADDAKIRSTAKAAKRGRKPVDAVKSPEVINEQLLVDVLKYLAPTLEQYKGCTVIDLYPGSCLWSRKIHDFLKPKCHLLLEPEAQYQAYIDRLVDSQCSTYKHIPLGGGNEQPYQDTYDRIFADNGPLPRPHSAADDPATLQTDRSLLVIGSLTRRNDLRFHGKQYSGALSSLYHLSWGSLVNAYMHRHGPVRMLLWTLEKDRAHFLPEWSVYRNHTDAAANVAMHVQAAVAVEPVVSRLYSNERSIRSRWSGLSVTREKMVQDKMSQLGIQVPRGREIFHHLTPQVLEQTPRTTTESPYEVRYSTVEQVEEALEDLKHHWDTRATAQYPVAADDTSGQPWRRKRRRPEELYPYLAFPGLADALLENPSKAVKAAARSKFRLEQGIQPGSLSKAEAGMAGGMQQPEAQTELTGIDVRTAFFADAALRGINLEMHCVILEEQGIDVADLKKRVMEFSDQVVEHVLRRRQVYEADFNRLVDDWTTFFAGPPLLALDQRQYEPLQASPEDFWPKKNLTLLDFTPTNRDLAVPGLADRRKAAHACRSIIKFLYTQKSQSVTSVLERLAPNASTDLLGLVPAITDPRKGGRLDPKHLKVRHLTSEMLEGLAKAWFEWPFRPEGWELDMGMSDIGPSSLGSKEPLTAEAVTADDDGEAVY